MVPVSILSTGGNEDFFSSCFPVGVGSGGEVWFIDNDAAVGLGHGEGENYVGG